MKMSDKKRWFSETYWDLQERNLDITWSNSDSEDQNASEIPRQKRLRTYNTDKSKSWISSISHQNITPPKENEHLNSENDSVEISCFVTSPSLKDDFLESPIIKSLQLDLSPPLIEDVPNTFNNTQEKSPVINRRHILKKIKWRYRLKKDMQLTQNIQEGSPSLPNAHFSQPIIINDTQESPHKCSLSPVEISPAKSEISPSWKIDPFPSQDSSQVASVDDGSFYDLGSSYYHEPRPRKKRYKKGGLASQLQKVLDVQSTSLAIWQHELYLSKTKKEVQLVGKGVEGVEFSFHLINKWKEYGCSICECKFASEEDFSKVAISMPNLQTENAPFLIIIDVSLSININYELNTCYKIFPPYAARMVEYQQKQTLCIINGSRFMSVS